MINLLFPIQPSDIDAEKIWRDHLFGPRFANPISGPPPEWMKGSTGEVATMAVILCQKVGAWVEVSPSEIIRFTDAAYTPTLIQDATKVMKDNHAIHADLRGICFTQATMNYRYAEDVAVSWFTDSPKGDASPGFCLEPESVPDTGLSSLEFCAQNLLGFTS